MKRLARVVALVATAFACGTTEETGFTKVPIAGSPQTGPADAWVTIVEFGDFQCSFCAKASPTVHQLLAAYPSDVRVVFKEYPLSFHANAQGAALAAVCADAQGKFWPMYDALYANNEKLGSSDLEGYAKGVGVDLDVWRACLPSDAAKATIDGDLALGKAVGVSGTPAFFINGVLVSGAQPYANFKIVVDAQLEKAKASGVDRAHYYDQVVLGN